jgi:hypothetical protein
MGSFSEANSLSYAKVHSPLASKSSPFAFIPAASYGVFGEGE